MSVQITLDQASLAHLQKQLKLLRDTGKYGLFHALTKLAFKIKTEAQQRLKGQQHIVTARLVNSVYVQAANPAKVNKPNNRETYEDKFKHVFDSPLTSVGLSDTELAVGTNVEYAGKIEQMDSYLYWAMRNVNVEQSVAQDMRDYMKFGIGVLPSQRPPTP